MKTIDIQESSSFHNQHYLNQVTKSPKTRNIKHPQGVSQALQHEQLTLPSHTGMTI